MSRDTVDGGLTLTGTIKWFDPVKGFGFIVFDEIDMDILLHANVLGNFGKSSIADGVEIKVIAHRSDRGIQASGSYPLPLPGHLTRLAMAKWTRWMTLP